MLDDINKRLLGKSDLPPIEIVNENSSFPVLLLCEHAGFAIPKALENLGVSNEVLMSHRGWDIGAEEVARGVSDKLNAPLILQRYSRLVIDSNRPPYSSTSIPSESDGVRIPANANVSEIERCLRIEEIFDPMNAAIESMFKSNHWKACFSIHSFTPVLNKEIRPWQAGFISRKDHKTPESLINAIHSQFSEMKLVVNKPYQIDDDTDWFIPAYAEKHSLTHALIEIRNDQISNSIGAEQWSNLLTDAIIHILEAVK